MLSSINSKSWKRKAWHQASKVGSYQSRSFTCRIVLRGNDSNSERALSLVEQEKEEPKMMALMFQMMTLLSTWSN